MKKTAILVLALGILFMLDLAAIAHERVVVVPIGGNKGYEPQNPLVIPASEFREDGVLVGSIFFPSSGGYLKGSADRSYGCIVAPAYLPDGVTVTKLSAMLYDNSLSTDISLTLHRASINISMGTHGVLATVGTAGQSTLVRNFSMTIIATPLVDAENYTYYITTCLRSELVRLYAAKVYYTK